MGNHALTANYGAITQNEVCGLEYGALSHPAISHGTSADKLPIHFRSLKFQKNQCLLKSSDGCVVT